jgi:hypothetical protein
MIDLARDLSDQDISLLVHLYFCYYENLSLMEGENVDMIPTYVCT